MDGENNGKPYCLMDDLGIKPTSFGNIHFDLRVLAIFCQDTKTLNLRFQFRPQSSCSLLFSPKKVTMENNPGLTPLKFNMQTKTPRKNIPSRELTYPTKREKENHLQNAIFG